MLYLMAEIWIYLLIAALLGGLSAWLVSHGRSLDRVDRTEGSWKTRLKASEEEWRKKVEAMETRLERELEERERHTAALTEQLQGERQRSGGLNDKLAEEAANYQGLRDELDSTRAKLRMLDDRLSIALEVGDKAEVALRRGTAEFEKVRAELETEAREAAAERDQARAQLKEARERRIDLEKQLAESRQGLEEAAAAAGDGEGAATGLMRARIRDLENQLRTQEARLDERAREAEALRETIERREARIRELEPLEDRVSELQDEVELLQAELDDVLADTGDDADGRARSNGVRSESVGGLELKIAAAVQDLPDLDALLARAPSSRPGGGLGPGITNGLMVDPGGTDLDDLRRIRGIGPVLQRKLRQLGYRTFAQIAGWTDADIERVCETLPIFPDRIRREGWVDQARELQKAVDGG